MNFKVFGGIAAGAVIGCGAAMLFYNKKIKELKIGRETAESELSKISYDYDQKLEKLTVKYNDLEFTSSIAKQNIILLYNAMQDAYCKISNVDMLADISAIKDVPLRDKCFSYIDSAIVNIDKLCNLSDEAISVPAIVKNAIDNIHDCAKTMQLDISRILEMYTDNDDDEDDDDEYENDSDIETISPRHIILNCIDGKSMVFDADPDGGFEVLDGSDVENNDYCIVAQNVPKLYNILFDSVKEQLQSHYVAKINSDAFDMILDDLVITVSLEFINDTDAVITAVNAVVPFELFGLNTKEKTIQIYTIKEGELDNGDVIHYFRSALGSYNIQNQQECLEQDMAKTSKETEMEIAEATKSNIDVSVSDENIQFIINTIGYSKESLKSFMTKMAVLYRINSEAAESIESAYADIIREIYFIKANNKIDESNKLRIANLLRSLIYNMNRNHGSAIKAYMHNH